MLRNPVAASGAMSSLFEVGAVAVGAAAVGVPVGVGADRSASGGTGGGGGDAQHADNVRVTSESASSRTFIATNHNALYDGFATMGSRNRWLLLVIAVGGCDLVSGVDGEFREVSPSDCAALGGTCVAAHSTAWDGPHAVFFGASDPSPCSQNYAIDSGGLLGAKLTVEATTAPCGCRPPADACVGALTKHMPQVCTTALQIVLSQLVPDQCTPVQGIADQSLQLTTSQSVGQFCEASKQGSLPLPSWTERARVCETSEAITSCDSGELCAPRAPATATLCLRRPGDRDCPEGDFRDKRLFHESVNDTRSCDCGDVSGECEGSLAMYSAYMGYTAEQICSGVPADLPIAITDIGQCSPPVSPTLVKYALYDNNTACTLSGADALRGSIEPADPVTLCCLP